MADWKGRAKDSITECPRSDRKTAENLMTESKTQDTSILK